MRALDLAREGRKQSEIAEALDVSKGAVSRWLATARRGGPDALRSHPAPGPARKITAEQLRMIPDLLSHGAEASSQLMRSSRVAPVMSASSSTSMACRSKARVKRAPGVAQGTWTRRMPWTGQSTRGTCACSHVVQSP